MLAGSGSWESNSEFYDAAEYLASSEESSEVGGERGAVRMDAPKLDMFATNMHVPSARGSGECRTCQASLT